MNVNSNTGSLASSISSRTEKDRNELRQIGRELLSAEDAYRGKLRNGSEAQIAEAQMDYEKAAQKLKARVEMQSAINRLINSIIEKIGQIGR